MKKAMLSILLASQLVISLATACFAATDQVTYSIGSISPTGYLYDDDASRVDFLDTANDAVSIRYGETVYFPLLNKNPTTNATPQQLEARAVRRSGELEREHAYSALLKADYEASRLALSNAVNAAILAQPQIKVELTGLLAAIEDETLKSPEELLAEIAELKKEVALQKAVLDSAAESKKAARQAEAELLLRLDSGVEELRRLEALMAPVERRDRLIEQYDTLYEGDLDSAAELVDHLEAERNALIAADLGVAALDPRKTDALAAISDLERQLDSLLDGIKSPVNERSYRETYRAYLDARAVYEDGGILFDSGAEDYLVFYPDEPPLEGETDAVFEPEVAAYGESIRALHRAFSREGTPGVRRALQISDALAITGHRTDESREDGTLYEQRNYRQAQLDEVQALLGETRAVDDKLVSARLALVAVEEKLSRLQRERTALDQSLAEALAGLREDHSPFSADPSSLMVESLTDALEEQNDLLQWLRAQRDELRAECEDADALLTEETAAHDELAARLHDLTDPDAPNALTRAIRFGQNYPFLRTSANFRTADSGDALFTDAAIDKIDKLLALFTDPLTTKSFESSTALLEALDPYEVYLASLDAFEAQEKLDRELTRSTTAARTAHRQAAAGVPPYPYVYESKAVEGVRLKSDWEEGKKFVDEISLVKKRYQSDTSYTGERPSEYIYFIALKIKERDTTSTGSEELYGTISMRKSAKNGSSHTFDYEDVKLDVNFELGFRPPEDANLIPIDPAVFDPDEDFDQDDEETFDFEADDDSYYVANTTNQKKLVLGLNTDYDEEIGDLYADQTPNLSFWNGNGGSFNRSGYLYLAAEEDSFVYKVGDKAKLTPVDAEYDDYENCFVLRTRSLGHFVVSDVELELIDPFAPDPEEEIVIVITPDQTVSTPTVPTAPAKPPTGWSEGSRSDEDEAPVSSSAPALPEPESVPEVETPESSSPEELPTAGESGDISAALLIGLSIAGALLLTLTVFLVVGAKQGRFRKR